VHQLDIKVLNIIDARCNHEEDVCSWNTCLSISCHCYRTWFPVTFSL